jgi:hypothetical protein
MYNAPEAVVGTGKFHQGKSGVLFGLDYLFVFSSFLWRARHPGLLGISLHLLTLLIYFSMLLLC